MNYFELKADKENKDFFLYFNNRQIYYTGNKPNFFKDLNIDVVKFCAKANNLLNKYEINLPIGYPKNSYTKSLNGKKAYSFPLYDFLMCVNLCTNIELNFKFDTSKILRRELIYPNSRKGIVHACSLAFIAFHYLNKESIVEIPYEKDNKSNPDLIINGLDCEIKTIMEIDWEKDIDPKTGKFKIHTQGEDVCYDVGTFISKSKSGYKGIKQADVVFSDLSAKSFGNLLANIKFFKDIKKYGCKLPQPKKCRIIYFARSLMDCISFYVDFDPKLWTFIKNDETKTQRAILEFKIPGNGKPHKIDIPPPDF